MLTKRNAFCPEDVIALKTLGKVEISPDGNSVAFSVSRAVMDATTSTHRSHIWIVSSRGGAPSQLTNGPKGDGGPNWSSDGSLVAFTSDRGDKNQVWLIRPDGGEAKQLTRSKNGVSAPRWSPDGTRIVFLVTEVDAKKKKTQKKAGNDAIVVGKDDIYQTHLWGIDVDGEEGETKLLFTLPDSPDDVSKDPAVQLTDGDFTVSDPQWSPDGASLAFVSSPTPNANDTMFRSTIHIMDLESRTIRPLTGRKGGEKEPRWSPDGKSIALLHSPEGYGQYDIEVVPVSGGKPSALTATALDRTCDTLSWSPAGTTIYARTTDRARRQLIAVPVDGGEIKRIAQDDCVVGSVSIAEDGDKYACYKAEPDKPGDVWVGSTGSNELKRRTDLNPQVRLLQTSNCSIISWKSSDGLEIEGLLSLPLGHKEGEPIPLMVEPHGGPHGGAKDLDFKPLWHIFGNEGYAVFAPNFRGSDGYGREFARANYNQWGKGDYDDLITGVDHLIKEGIADPDKLVIGGSSYGGFMTSWAIGQTDRFKAACAVCGVINHTSFYGQTDIPDFSRMYFGEGPPHDQPDLYRDLSPISYVGNATTPTLILHGEKDIRVPIPQSEELYAGLKAAGVETEFIRYPREGHGITEPRHLLDMMHRWVDWYKRHLT